MNLLNKTAILERSLDAASLRQKVVANNIANVDTPHFKRSEVVFEHLLQQAVGASSTIEGVRTHPKHLPIGQQSFDTIQPIIETDQQSTMNNNMNNVDIDYEMSLMAKNQLRYNALTHQLNQEIKRVRTAIDGRR